MPIRLNAQANVEHGAWNHGWITLWRVLITDATVAQVTTQMPD